MAKIFTKKITISIVILLLLIVALFFVNQKLRVYDRVAYNIKEWRHANEWKNKSLWLPDYKVIIEAKPIKTIDNNLSGLTWNHDTKTLFAVVNNPQQIIELSTTGELLRSIKLTGFGDPEAVEYIGDERFIVADERRQKLIKVIITPTTTEINTEGLQQLTLGMGLTDNKGIEGLAWDSVNKKLYAAKERDPIHIYEVTGFPQKPNTTMDIEVGNNPNRDQRLFVRDVSSLDFNQQYQHLLVLSDESKLIVEIDKKGRPISSLSLRFAEGLTKSIPQAEGIAMDDENNLYLVSEPNLFYVFKKKTSD